MYVYYLFALIVIILDQLTKWVVIRTMELGEQITVMEGFFYFTSHRNSGAAWGIFQGQMLFFYIVTLLVVAGVIFYMQKYAKNDKLLATALGLILGGALGNFIDRLVHREVVDFIDVIIFGYDFPIFNIADSALTIGVILIIIGTILEETKKGKTNK
ncbi:signal peptidase II [Virgibacillus xinjiangensis]|uniref:Lipoprotein signal peptidase n=1 Tax=Virgibacillus xinjiangensis TaxID=393090 RepID=A0ABV7CVF6_9BACI